MSGINDQFKSAGKTLSEFLKKTTDHVSERWEELTAIQDRRREAWELAREREKLMVEMGAKVYSLHKRDKVKNRDLLSDCERIDTIGSEIARLEREIEELRREKMQAEAPEVEVSDDTPVVDDEDIDTEAAEVPVDEPQSGVSEADADEEGPTMIPVEVEEEEPCEEDDGGAAGEEEFESFEDDETGEAEDEEDEEAEATDFAPPVETEMIEPEQDEEDDAESPDEDR